jgi:hypothetical protein
MTLRICSESRVIGGLPSPPPPPSALSIATRTRLSTIANDTRRFASKPTPLPPRDNPARQSHTARRLHNSLTPSSSPVAMRNNMRLWIPFQLPRSPRPLPSWKVIWRMYPLQRLKRASHSNLSRASWGSRPILHHRSRQHIRHGRRSTNTLETIVAARPSCVWKVLLLLQHLPNPPNPRQLQRNQRGVQSLHLHPPKSLKPLKLCPSTPHKYLPPHHQSINPPRL